MACCFCPLTEAPGNQPRRWEETEIRRRLRTFEPPRLLPFLWSRLLVPSLTAGLTRVLCLLIPAGMAIAVPKRLVVMTGMMVTVAKGHVLSDSCWSLRGCWGRPL